MLEGGRDVAGSEIALPRQNEFSVVDERSYGVFERDDLEVQKRVDVLRSGDRRGRQRSFGSFGAASSLGSEGRPGVPEQAENCEFDEMLHSVIVSENSGKGLIPFLR